MNPMNPTGLAGLAGTGVEAGRTAREPRGLTGAGVEGGGVPEAAGLPRAVRTVRNQLANRTKREAGKSFSESSPECYARLRREVREATRKALRRARQAAHAGEGRALLRLGLPRSMGDGPWRRT